MKIKILFKTPDAVNMAIEENPEIGELDRASEVHEFLSQYIKYGECVTIEFDTVMKTATVLKA